MSPRNLGVVAVALAAVGIAGAVAVSQRGRQVDEPARALTPSNEALDKMVIDYAFQAMNGFGRQAVASCGSDLAGQEADVTAKVIVRGTAVVLTEVKFGQPAWNEERLKCVTGAFEGQQRDASADGVRTKFPDGSEYEVDARIAFQMPTLQYSE
ncbi:MAG: hypothetical protein MUC96_07335 [Myxococcaceae bacterium]|jgi:hypothetical protein|nr:hypothetical protein [Myxococcaceae bacterium]